jgi:hypothetical protein
MTSSITTLLIVAFASLLLGVVAGLLLNSLRGEQREEEPDSAQDTPPGGRPGGYMPVVRLWREKTSATLVVEVDGKSYVSPAPLTLAQRESLERALAEFSGWLGVVVAAVTPQQAAGSIQPAAGHTQPALSADQALPVSSPSAAATPQAPTMRVEKVRPVSPAAAASAAPVLKGAGKAASPTPAKEEPKSIVGQIDVILQEMLERVGMDNRGIALSEDPRRGVIVSIGLDRFDGIDAVTDDEVKKLLRAAVNEWERRQERLPHV